MALKTRAPGGNAVPNCIGVIGQKGGVGKSTVARLLACQISNSGWNAKIADFDYQQSTSYHWLKRRQERGLRPDLAIKKYRTVDQALADTGDADILIMDGAGHASQQTLQIAKACELLVLPTSVTFDELQPTADLFLELTDKGIDPRRMVAVFVRVPPSSALMKEAIAYLMDPARNVPYLSAYLPSQMGFMHALNDGSSLNETPYPTLNEQADSFGQALIDHLKMVAADLADEKGRVA